MKYRLVLTLLLLGLSQIIYSSQSERIRLIDIDFYSRDNINFNLNDSLEKNSQLILNYNLADRFKINYSIDSLRSQEQVKYIIEGFDFDWIKDTECNSIMTTNLLPGRYLIRIGIFSDNQMFEEKSIDLIITPPFWKTWWFKAFITIGFIGVFLIAIIILIINNSKLRRKLKSN